MRALTLDYRRQPQARWIGVALLVAGVAGAGFLGTEYRQLADEVERAESGMREHGAAARKQTVAPATEGDVQKVALEVKKAREVVLQLKTPWNELFASVESVQAPNVALLGIESDVEKQRVKINAEAKNLGAMLDYLRELEGRPTFADVYLQSHQTQQQDPQHPVRFVLTAAWLERK
jgi:hypothetical protein